MAEITIFCGALIVSCIIVLVLYLWLQPDLRD